MDGVARWHVFPAQSLTLPSSATVKQWDEKTHKQVDRLYKLMVRVSTMNTTQNELQNKIKTVQEHQAEMDKHIEVRSEQAIAPESLCSITTAPQDLERKVEQLRNSGKITIHGGEQMRRQETFARAMLVEQELDMLEHKLKNLVSTVNTHAVEDSGSDVC